MGVLVPVSDVMSGLTLINKEERAAKAAARSALDAAIAAGTTQIELPKMPARRIVVRVWAD
jgi:hypothetical protein